MNRQADVKRIILRIREKIIKKCSFFQFAQCFYTAKSRKNLQKIEKKYTWLTLSKIECKIKKYDRHFMQIYAEKLFLQEKSRPDK